MPTNDELLHAIHACFSQLDSYWFVIKVSSLLLSLCHLPRVKVCRNFPSCTNKGIGSAVALLYTQLQCIYSTSPYTFLIQSETFWDNPWNWMSATPVHTTEQWDALPKMIQYRVAFDGGPIGLCHTFLYRPIVWGTLSAAGSCSSMLWMFHVECSPANSASHLHLHV